MRESTAQCPEPSETVKFVDSCPESAEKLEEAAIRFNCQKYKCPTSFVYHCVMNSNRTKTIELCAPKTYILGYVCVEYNFKGGIVQRNRNAKCYSCPETYFSNEVFKYTECFEINNPKTTQTAKLTKLSRLNTKDNLTTPPPQSNGSTKKTKTNKSMNINNTADLTSFLPKKKTNTNKTKPGASLTSHSSSLQGTCNWSMSISCVALGVFASQLNLLSP